MKGETEMTTDVSPPTAKIYQFPVGGRRALKIEPTKVQADLKAPSVSFGAWYHEEAIQDSKRAGERV